MKPLHVAFVWHMHQPYYKDDLTNPFLLPWVRLRCAKDYYKMPALLDDYPAIKQTFNLVPALVAQVQDYAEGRFTDIYLDLACRPVSELSGDERAFIARWMTEGSQLRRVRQYPRYLELVRKREQQERGQAELIPSPYYHPILPLIADLSIARVARPDLAVPRRAFKHPDDAAEQLRLAVEAHVRGFGRPPRGAWPPEAAISDEALRLAVEQGLEWMLSDEGVLARSQENAINRDAEGQVMQPDVLYAPYRVQGEGPPIRLLFHDARLSNAIGFEYHNSAPDEAAKDLV